MLDARSPDEEAFLRRFMAEERVLLRFILRYVPAVADARDVLQETLVTLWAKRAEFDASREFLPWACGIARLKIREFWRKQPRWASFATEDVINLLDQRRDAIESEDSLRLDKLRECLRKLPAEQRELMRSYYEEEESVESLALRQGRSGEAIYKSLQRTRRMLLDCIGRGLRTEEALS